MNLPASVAKHVIAVHPQPDGSTLAHCSFFTSPAPQAIVQAFAKRGLSVLQINFDGQQTKCCIRYKEST